MLDALQGGITVGLFIAGVYLPIALIRAANKRVKIYLDRRTDTK